MTNQESLRTALNCSTSDEHQVPGGECPKGPRWALYARSGGASREQATKQLEPLREYAAREGAEVVAELVDLGRGRRGRAQAFALVEAGVVDRVVVYDLDRLGRKRADTDDWLTPFADYPGRLYVLHGPGGQGPVDLTSAYSRFVLGVLAAFAEAEERHQEARKEFQRRTQEEKRAPRADTREA